MKCMLVFFFFPGSQMARIHLLRWISGVFGVRISAPAYNNALSYQLSYAHRIVYMLVSKVTKIDFELIKS